jgi:hypothetical protein
LSLRKAAMRVGGTRPAKAALRSCATRPNA